MNNIYNFEFYKHRNQNTLYSAKKILDIVLSTIPPQNISSALDFGCGVGTWLSVLRERERERLQ